MLQIMIIVNLDIMHFYSTKSMYCLLYTFLICNCN